MAGRPQQTKRLGEGERGRMSLLTVTVCIVSVSVWGVVYYIVQWCEFTICLIFTFKSNFRVRVGEDYAFFSLSLSLSLPFRSKKQIVNVHRSTLKQMFLISDCNDLSKMILNYKQNTLSLSPIIGTTNNVAIRQCLAYKIENIQNNFIFAASFIHCFGVSHPLFLSLLRSKIWKQ